MVKTRSNNSVTNIYILFKQLFLFVVSNICFIKVRFYKINYISIDLVLYPFISFIDFDVEIEMFAYKKIFHLLTNLVEL